MHLLNSATAKLLNGIVKLGMYNTYIVYATLVSCKTWGPIQICIFKYNPIVILFPVITDIQISWKMLLMVPHVGMVYSTVIEDKTIL